MALRRILPVFFALFLLGSFVSLPSIANAQQEGTENENAEGGEGEESEGQSGADAETGASEEESSEAATEEEGPPWTYQMARISIALILLLVAGVGLLYYKLIATRQKGTT